MARRIVLELLAQLGSSREARQYLKEFSEIDQARFAVVKVGGGIIADQLDELASALAFLHRLGLRPVVLHGAGPQVDKALNGAGIETRKHDGLRVTEVMYNPVGGSDYEFIEIRNTGIAELDLTDVRLRGGVEFDFPAMTLAPGGYAVIAGDLVNFAARYGALPNVVGPFVGDLSNGGEDVILRLPEPYDAAALRLEYDDAWYPGTDGDGLSLVINDESAHRRTWSEQAGWRASGAAN